MSKLDFLRAKSIFCDVVDLPEPHRLARLDQACDGDEQLRQYVNALLDRDGAASDADSTGLASVLGDLPSDEPPPDGTWIGRQLGPFEIRERIGQGGMGDVYRAQRTADFSSEVAVKFARHARFSEDFARRFRDEIRFQASLSQHPNIAAIHEVGQTDEGIPYFVMDYVDGVRIDAYCDAEQLDARQRIALFRQVCDAVQFAHQNMVIHRDLKPSNILVTRQGIPILIDFGIAKLAATEGVESTMTGGAAFTPAYASPEQVRRERMTTATDIYSMGVILYELLTGHAPHSAKADFAEIVRMIVDDEPVRPSEIIARSETVTKGSAETRSVTPAVICSQRRTTVPRLRRLLRGDLDTVVLTAMHKLPSRRYLTAEQFSDDLHRCLEGLPIRARPDRWSYRAGKFIQRNYLAVSVAVLLMASLVAGVIGTTVMAVRANAARAEAQSQRELAVGAEVVATAMNDFLVELLQQATPRVAKGREVSVGEVVQLSLENLGDEFPDQPRVRLKLRMVLSDVLGELGRTPEAEAGLRQAVEEAEATLGPEDDLTLGLLNELAKLDSNLGNLQQSVEQYRELLARCEKVYGPNDRRTLVVVNDLSTSLRFLGEFEECERLSRRALAGRRKLYGETNRETLQSLIALSQLLDSKGDIDQAFDLAKEGHKKFLEHFGPNDVDTIGAAANCAGLLWSKNRWDEAEPIYRDVLEKRLTIFGETHPLTLDTLTNLALVLDNQDRAAEAEPLFRQSYDGFVELFGESHPHAIISANNLATTLEGLDRAEEAADIYIRILPICRKCFGEGHAIEIGIRDNLGTLRESQGRLAESAVVLQEAYDLAVEHLSGDDDTIAAIAEHLSRVQAALVQENE